MKRVIIIGCPGSGKSTFARSLAKNTDLPLFYLDMLNWNSDKSTVSKDLFISRLETVLSKELWIIDGNYLSTMEIRLNHCDTVIFLDYETSVCLSGISERKGKTRPDMPWVETEDDEEFLEFIRNFNTESRPQILELLNKYKYKNIIVFKNRNDADAYLNMMR